MDNPTLITQRLTLPPNSLCSTCTSCRLFFLTQRRFWQQNTTVDTEMLDNGFEELTTILVSRTVFSGIVTQYSSCSHCGGWLCMLVMMTVKSTELLRFPPSVATICWLIREVWKGIRTRTVIRLYLKQAPVSLKMENWFLMKAGETSEHAISIRARRLFFFF